MKKATWLLSAVAVIALIATPLPTVAATFTPYLGYEINDYEESVSTPVGHALSARYYSQDMELELPLKEPQDMCYYGERLYILDSGNGRIVSATPTFDSVEIVEGFHDAQGTEYSIVGACGLTVCGDHTFYIADTANCRVLKCQGNVVTQVLERPDDALRDTDAPFRASKVLVDTDNRVYVLAESINIGAFVFDETGEFVHFFGSNKIVQTAEVVANYLRKQFLTAEQRAGLKSFTPTTFTNFDIDHYGFIYTVTADASETATTGVLRWLNFKGNDILDTENTFGDVEKDGAFWSESLHTQFSDVDIDADGFVNLLDAGRGKVFQYTQTGKLLSVFGGYGNQQGTFGNPTAVESIGENVYVLDGKKQAVFVFSPTSYGAGLRKAYRMTDRNDPMAMEAWEEVLHLATNSQYPYYGIGMIYDAQGDYKQAMENFKLAGAHAEYSKAFREYRKILVRQNMVWFVLGLAAVIAVIAVALRIFNKRFEAVKGTAFSPMESKYAFPLYTIRHPVDGFEQFRNRGIHSWAVAFVLVVLWFLIKSWEFLGIGFSFNANRAQDYSFFITFLSTVGLFILFSVANWAVCTLLDGKGTLKEIVCVTAYSLLPMLVCSVLRIVLSNMLTLEEGAFLSILTVIGIGWTLLELLAGLYAIHQYSFLGTIGAVLATVVGMFVICFLLVLFYSLMQQTVSFAQSLIEEISMR